MNNTQIEAVIRNLLGGAAVAVGGWLVAHGVDQGTASTLTNAAMGVVVMAVGIGVQLAWSLLRKTALQLSKSAVSAAPGVEVKVDPAVAPTALVAAANDPTVSKINPETKP